MKPVASERRREANRRNGRKDGPKTDDGKQRSRLNSLKHGLTSSTLVVLPEEDRREYDEVLQGFRDSLQPENSVEDALVLRLAQAHWRSLRSRCIETGMAISGCALNHKIGSAVTHKVAVARPGVLAPQHPVFRKHNVAASAKQKENLAVSAKTWLPARAGSMLR